ncbi:hypothetical protein BGZ61DRAFT_30488 [Ilyonectria robusta]|uniref:uncharacterized protein n=1 Tax=Ilyonectria robusta TaxID=1079257 RepID=UPI001E8EB60B|nr:uncharacterized protein BGZ61DRAFT_30488 [Ilyonectria robusta]KAH8738325.1 hypothetical protein BGZ61DRAFT_30488 [Ilyonectria robusta]
MRSRNGSPAFLPRRFVFRIHKSASQLAHSSASCRGTAYFCIRRVVFICVFWACPSVLTVILPECQSVAQRERVQQSTVNSRQSEQQSSVACGLALGCVAAWGGLKRQAAGLAQERESPVRAAQCGRPQLASLSESQVWVHPKGPRGAWVRFLSDRDPPRALRSQVPERTQRQVQRA